MRDYYEGEFASDQATGIGRIYYAGGDVYVGEVQDLKKSGVGRLYEKKLKRYYEGSFYNDNKDGVGYYAYDQDAGLLAGKIYCGNFKNGKEEGAGEYIEEKNLANVYGLSADGMSDRFEEIAVYLSNGYKALGVNIVDLIKI